MKREHREANASKTKAKPRPPAPDMLALEAARLKIAQHIAAKHQPARVEAVPTTPGAQRMDNSPYRKESRE